MTIHLRQFNAAADAISDNADQRAFLREGMRGYEQTREIAQNRFADWQAARSAAAEIKWDAIEHLDTHLQEFASRLEARGTYVFWASDGEAARQYILEVIRKHEARTVVKSKTMTTEEIRLNDLLEAEGFEVVESDLGEYIVQLRGEPPYHIVFPAMHLKRGEIRDLFREKLGTDGTDDPEELTMAARTALRRTFLKADVGISGANFGIAETGMISITENEGNARLTTSLPKVHIAVMGIEKILPKLEHLALFLPMLATAGAGQSLTCYNSLFGGPRQPGESDGPEEFHVVLLDNHRTRLLADPKLRDALRCIRCGACINVCPVFTNVGGHTYGTTYQGPIGAVITPHLRGLSDWGHLSRASSLCGACAETCPVRIDLHHHLLHNREALVQQDAPLRKRLALRAFTFVMRRPWAYRVVGRLGRWAHVLTQPIHGTRLDPLGAWRRTRDLPDPAAVTFKEYWRNRTR